LRQNAVSTRENYYVVQRNTADFAVKYKIFERGAAFSVFPVDYHTVGHVKDAGKLLLAYAVVHIVFARFATTVTFALVEIQAAANVTAEIYVVVT